MAGINSITERIRKDAQNKAEQIIAAAEQEADAIRRRAADEAEHTLAQRRKSGEADANKARERRITSARMDGKKLLLNTKQQLLSEVFTLALADILDLPQADYEELLIALLTQADSSGEILLNSRDRERIDGKAFLARANSERKKQGITAEVTLSEQTIPAQGGFVLKTGDIEQNYTIEALLRQKRETLEQELSTILFH